MIQQNKYTVSNALIAISIVFTLLSFYYPLAQNLWLSNYDFNAWNYVLWFIQLFSSNFIHWWLMHLLFNSIFIYYFWNIVEIIIGKKKMILFFVLNAIFTWIWITFLSSGITIWISGFALALLSYYTIELWNKNNPEYKWWITAIIINIAIWFTPWISFLWHFLWMIFGWLYWCINRYVFNWQR